MPMLLWASLLAVSLLVHMMILYLTLLVALNTFVLPNTSYNLRVCPDNRRCRNVTLPHSNMDIVALHQCVRHGVESGGTCFRPKLLAGSRCYCEFKCKIVSFAVVICYRISCSASISMCDSYMTVVLLPGPCRWCVIIR